MQVKLYTPNWDLCKMHAEVYCIQNNNQLCLHCYLQKFILKFLHTTYACMFVILALKLLLAVASIDFYSVELLSK